MILLTPEPREQLLANGRQRDFDHMSVVKFFNPLGESVRLATELDEDGDTLFGLCVSHVGRAGHRVGSKARRMLRKRSFR